jgi:arabinogalactan endo-1,4-beta-galactosidase
MKLKIGLLAVCISALCGCGGGGTASAGTSTSPSSPPPPTAAVSDYAYGADISWVSQQESLGYAVYDSAGVKTDPFALLKGYGINAIRLRVWVNGKDGWNGRDDTLAKALRAKARGQRVMIDFHYSDDWADPGKQIKPAAWASYSVDQLKAAVYAHTRDTLAHLKANGIDVTWVQVGNEINNGLIWPEGKLDHFEQLTAFTNSGYDAAKSVYPDAAVIVHVDDPWWFDNFMAQRGKIDIIGISYYPEFTPSKDWRVEAPKLSEKMAELTRRLGKPLMVVETGFRMDQPAEAKAMLTDLIRRNQALGKQGLGVFYWEPTTIASWTKYGLGALDQNNRITEAMDAFRH